jgi:hypothetical protein
VVAKFMVAASSVDDMSIAVQQKQYIAGFRPYRWRTRAARSNIFTPHFDPHGHDGEPAAINVQTLWEPLPVIGQGQTKMHMIDWNTYRERVATGGYGRLGRAKTRTGSLGAKTREPIALAVAVSLRCDGI